MTPTRIVAALGVLAFGVVAPGLAAALAVAAALLVATWVVAAALGDRRSMPTSPVRPFAGNTLAPSIPHETPDVADLAREIATSRRGIPSRTAAHLREIARGRMLDHHRLDLTDPLDRAAAADLMSPPLRALVLDDRADDVRLRDLPTVLDELERP